MLTADATLGDALIPVINKLQDIFSQVTVDLRLSLPQVAVVGSQSSGKSSVLESLVGRDFLPRGSDIVTRRPLVLQLVKTSATSNGKSEWGEFLHAPGKLFFEFDTIRQEIQAETDRVVGTNKNVSDKPIRLKIFSPHVLTMTLVDLPGMTKVPVGDQPSNIEARIRDMVLDHIRPSSVIILAVSPANADLANSDGIQMARMVDPEGVRTIGVLTKLDIMDRGTNAVHILRNQHIPLRLGYVAVVNRSQEDINKATSIPDARRAEERFFYARPDYREVLPQCGITNLARRLNTLLVEHIRALLPGLRRAIAESLESRSAELRALGDALPLESKSSKGAYLLQLLCEYSDRFAAMLEGRHQDLSTQRLSGGARIRAVFNTLYAPLLRDLTPNKDVSDEAILTVIKNGAGAAGNLLVPQEPFELLVRKSVSSLLAPSLACKEAVYEEMMSIADQACPRELSRFPGMQRQLASVVLDFIRSNADPADRMIHNLVDCEHDFINCDHPDFIGGRGAIRAVMQERSLRAAQGAGAVGKGGKDVETVSGKESSNPPAPTATGGSHARNKSGLAGHMLPVEGLKASGLGGLSAGLKGIPETTLYSSDELLSRTRRRSDDGGVFGGMDNALHLGAGGPSSGQHQTPPSHYPNNHHPAHHSNSASHLSTLSLSNNANPNSSSSSSSSWFSWFHRGGDGRSGGQGFSLDDSAVGAGGRAGVGSANGYSNQGGAMYSSGPGGGPQHTEQEETEVEVIRRLVDSYFSIVRRNLMDAVPKAVMHFMVNNTKRGLQQHLIQQLYKEELLEQLLCEREDVVSQRRTAQEAMAALQAAAKALAELPNELGSNTTVPSPALGPSLPDPGSFLDRSLDRNPSMLAAARIASAATASLTGHTEAAMNLATGSTPYAVHSS